MCDAYGKPVNVPLKIYSTEIMQNITFFVSLFFLKYIVHPSAQNTTPTTSTTRAFLRNGASNAQASILYVNIVPKSVSCSVL